MFSKKGCLVILGVFVFVIVLYIVLTNFGIVKNKVRQYTSFFLSEEKQFEMFETSLTEEDGFFDKVSEHVRKQGYEHYMHGLIYSEELVEIEFILTDKEVTEEAQSEILAVFHETANNRRLNPAIFEVKIRSELSGS